MEDSSAFLREISSFKHMLDEVNEEIEQNIHKTREIESEIVKHSETEDGYLKRECNLAKLISLSSFELDGLNQVTGSAKFSLSQMENGLRSLKIVHTRVAKQVSDKREEFVLQCHEFQRDIASKENGLSLLLAEKEVLENEKDSMTKKINALENSVEEYFEEILDEFKNSISALETELRQHRSEYTHVLKDISDLETLLGSISSHEELDPNFHR